MTFPSSREPERYNEHGQDDRVSLDERLWDRDMTPGTDDRAWPAPSDVAGEYVERNRAMAERELERWAAFLREVLPLDEDRAA